MRIITFTVLALLAFAANSIICRLALQPGYIDAASFTTLRVVSGVFVLLLFASFTRGWPLKMCFNWRSVVGLNFYMIFFSLAYVLLETGTGALVLFTAVQLTMFGFAIWQKEIFSMLNLFGLSLAFAGVIYLVSPGASAPDMIGVLFMVLAGVGWGLFSVAGRGNSDPILSILSNFVYCIPAVLFVSFLMFGDLKATTYGVFLAVLSGAIMSGVGYIIWYSVLPYLTSGYAATVQLSVPALAAFGGVILLSEPLTMRLVLSSVIILGGVAMALHKKAGD